MKQIGGWLARQFDDGLTPIGAVIGLTLVFAGIAGAVAAVSGNFWISVFLLGICATLLGALFVAAISTDPEQKLSRNEKKERWKRLPILFKASFTVLGLGPLLAGISSWLLPGAAKYFPFLLLCTGISSMLFAKGMQTHLPPIPVPGQEPLTSESSPVQYRKKLQSMVWASYITGLMMIAGSVLYFAK